MTRTHIHCASGRFGEEGVISGKRLCEMSASQAEYRTGVRKSCDLFIYIDVVTAMANSIEFAVSPNGVILTRGSVNFET